MTPGGLTRRGWTMLAAGVAWCAVATIVGQRDLWWPGLFLAMLPVASWLLLLPSVGGFTLTRHITPTQVSVGEVAVVELTVAAPPVELGGIASFRDRLAPALGEARWHLLAPSTGGRTRRLSYQVRPAWRGRHRIGPAERVTGDGLGLARLRRTQPDVAELIVTPHVELLPERRAASGIGALNDPSLQRVGLAGSDDVLVREYVDGDDIRRVHWRSTAHSGKLMVRREERAWDPTATVLLDNREFCFTHRRPEPRLEWAVSAAASICRHLLDHGFDVSLVDASGRRINPLSTGGNAGDLITAHLTEVGTERTSDLGPALAVANAGGESQLLIAIMSSAGPAEVSALTEVTRPGRICWALVVSDGPADHTIAMVRDAGWDAVLADPRTSVGQAWQQLGRGRA